MPAEYRNIEYRLHESLVQIQEMLSLLEFDRELFDSVISCKNLIKTKKYDIAVMGEFKRGKSSLINALLGSKILPADTTPTTATVNRITYGTEPKTVVTYKDGGSEEIHIDELSNYVTKLTPSGESRASRIKEATVYFPAVICQNHVDIIDTPGLNDDERMTRITIDMIANVDAVVIPIHARAPFSETEKAFVCQLIESDGIDNLIFVVTFMDQLDEDDYVYENFMEYIKRRIQTDVISELEKRQSPEAVIAKAHLLLDNLRITGISSSLALESFVSNSREARKKSRFEEFSVTLLHTVTAKQLENAVRKTVESIRHIVSQFDEQNQKRLSEIDRHVQLLDICEKNVRQHCGESERTLDSAFASGFGKLQETVNGLNAYKNLIANEFIKELSGVRANTHESIASAMYGASTRLFKGINDWQRSTVNKEIYSNFQSAADRLKDWHDGQWRQCVEDAGVDVIDGFKDTASRMLRFVETSLEKVSFYWHFSPIPQINDLTHCNPIETVKYAADVSISGYIKEINNALMGIRKNWFGQLAEYTEAFSNAVLGRIAKKKEAYDIQYKAHITNYRVLSDNSKAILGEAQMLMDEFICGN